MQSGTYSEPVKLDPAARVFPVEIQQSDRGTIKLTQESMGRTVSIYLTPAEAAALASIAAVA